MKKYQTGGELSGYTQYWQNPLSQDDPMQYLLQQFGGLGYNFNPFQGNFIEQLQTVTPESLMENVRSTYGISEKIGMTPSMFSGLNPLELKSLTQGFYDPIFEEGREDALSTLTSNLSQFGGHGMAGTGGDIRKEILERDFYNKSIDKTFLGIEEQQGTQMASILDKITQAHKTGIGLRYNQQV